MVCAASISCATFGLSTCDTQRPGITPGSLVAYMTDSTSSVNVSSRTVASILTRLSNVVWCVAATPEPRPVDAVLVVRLWCRIRKRMRSSRYSVSSFCRNAGLAVLTSMWSNGFCM